MTVNKLNNLTKEIRSHEQPLRAKLIAHFFQTGKGQYGEGDRFLGLTVPLCRKIAKKYTHLSQDDVCILLTSKYHEERLIALFLMISHFEKTKDKHVITNYLNNVQYVNNWDLVDTSADKLLGAYLRDQVKDEKKISATLLKLAKSKHMWSQRIAMISTFAFIKHGETKYTYMLADELLGHKHDLMHKAVGWMLREAGKRVAPNELRKYITLKFRDMSRTTLRYAIEKFHPEERAVMLAKR
ncbi:MAG: DNA alkylation repair protein [Patescibacteria group bacterium]